MARPFAEPDIVVVFGCSINVPLVDVYGQSQYNPNDIPLIVRFGPLDLPQSHPTVKICPHVVISCWTTITN